VANLGDSRAVLCRRGAVVAETKDHKPSDPPERARIEAAGGYVWEEMEPSRVDGYLAVSRAFGSYNLKDEARPHAERKISCVPDEYTWQTEPGDVLVVACDGLWDVLTSKQVARKVFDDYVASEDLAILAKDLIEKAFAAESTDNISCVVAAFGPFTGPEKPAQELTLGKYMRAKPEEKLRYQAFWAYNGFEQPTEPMPQIPQRGPKEPKGKKVKNNAEPKPLGEQRPPPVCEGMSIESVLKAALVVDTSERSISEKRPEPLPVLMGQKKAISPVSPPDPLSNPLGRLAANAVTDDGPDLNATLRTRDPLNMTLRTSSFHPPARETDVVDTEALYTALESKEYGAAIWHYITKAQ
jgi:hypothetical protein